MTTTKRAKTTSKTFRVVLEVSDEATLPNVRKLPDVGVASRNLGARKMRECQKAHSE
jgi:hypothetical protein